MHTSNLAKPSQRSVWWLVPLRDPSFCLCRSDVPMDWPGGIWVFNAVILGIRLFLVSPCSSQLRCWHSSYFFHLTLACFYLQLHSVSVVMDLRDGVHHTKMIQDNNDYALVVT